jgi:two-component system sensor histidine kinase TctE
LAGLISQTELALRENDIDVIKARLHKLHAGTQRSAHLVNQLLSLARSGSEVALEPLDLALLAQDVAREFSPRAITQQIDLGYEGELHVYVAGHALLLKEALSNILDNAIRYGLCPDFNGSSRLTVSIQAATDQWCLCVEDNGPGLDDVQLAQALERFWRGNELPGGCGLGLAIAQEIMQRHNGRIELSHASPHGLKVCCFIPRVDPVR